MRISRNVYWYVYLEGEQVWLLGSAPINGNQSSIPLQAFTGAQFPPDFLAGDVVSSDWGLLLMEFTGPDSATASWTSILPGYSDGELDLTRLTGLGGHSCLD